MAPSAWASAAVPLNSVPIKVAAPASLNMKSVITVVSLFGWIFEIGAPDAYYLARSVLSAGQSVRESGVPAVRRCLAVGQSRRSLLGQQPLGQQPSIVACASYALGSLSCCQ